MWRQELADDPTLVEARKITLVLVRDYLRMTDKLNPGQRQKYHQLLAQAIAWVIANDLGLISDLYDLLMKDMIANKDFFAAIKLLPQSLRMIALNACLTKSNVWFGKKFADDVELQAQIKIAYQSECENLQDFDVMMLAKATARPRAAKFNDHCSDNPYYNFNIGMYYLYCSVLNSSGFLHRAVELNPNPLYKKAYYVSLGNAIDLAVKQDPANGGEFSFARKLITTSNLPRADWLEGIKTLPIKLAADLLYACLNGKDFWLDELFAGDPALRELMQRHLQSCEIQQINADMEQINKGLALMEAQRCHTLYVRGITELCHAVTARKHNASIETYENIGDAISQIDDILSKNPASYEDLRKILLMCDPSINSVSRKVLLNGIIALPVKTQLPLLRKCLDKQSWLGVIFADSKLDDEIQKQIRNACLTSSGFFSVKEMRAAVEAREFNVNFKY